MSEKFPSQLQDKFTVRFPGGLRDAIAERAKQNGRSMNSEIIAALDAWLGGDRRDALSQENIELLIKIATDTFTKELSKNFDLVPKKKDD
ncbi:Arc family DNA-binding protein [Edwardsiella piscicida]|nr:Arc family DNA-binding protein [Edwardsiella piscicida]QBB13918.1 Arc family DNA-binding protein [Edwardsiella piscicida]